MSNRERQNVLQWTPLKNANKCRYCKINWPSITPSGNSSKSFPHSNSVSKLPSPLNNPCGSFPRCVNVNSNIRSWEKTSRSPSWIVRFAWLIVSICSFGNWESASRGNVNGFESTEKNVSYLYFYLRFRQNQNVLYKDPLDSTQIWLRVYSIAVKLPLRPFRILFQ